MGKLICETHPRAIAANQCSTCRRLWCNLCVKNLTVGSNTMRLCIKCNGRLVEPSVAAGPSGPSQFALGDLLGRVFSVEGLITAGAIAIGLEFLSRLPIVGRVFYIGSLAALVACYFQIIDHIGQGKAGFPGPSDAVDDVWGIISLTLRGLFCVALGFLPLIIWYARGGTDETRTLSSAIYTVGGLLLLGQLYMPAVLLAIVLTGTTAAAFYPIAWFKIVFRAPLSYLLLVAMFIATAILGLIGKAVAAVAVGRIPLVGGVGIAFVGNLLLFVQAAIVGGFLRANAEKFGWD